MKCRICSQQLLPMEPSGDHHLKPWPLDVDLCSGCGKAALDIEVWLIRAGCRRMLWALKIQDEMKGILETFK